MSANNSKPKPTANAPVVTVHEQPSQLKRYMLFLVPALFGSTIVHGVLLGLFILLSPSSSAETPGTEELAKNKDQSITADTPPDQNKDKETFNVVDDDPTPSEFDTNINYALERIADVSVPGTVNPSEQVGILNAPKDNPPVSIPAPGGLGGGQGGALEGNFDKGNSMAFGEPGGFNIKGVPISAEKGFAGRSGATKEFALRNGGGTDASEAAVARGLKWLIRQQDINSGHWGLNGAEANAVAGTAFGLLPFLAAGFDHRPKTNNPYDKNIGKALDWLIKQQRKDGFYGGTMYSHGLASIAMCEAYGMTQDPKLRRSAQMALDLIVNAQSDTHGGWCYPPVKQAACDLSVCGWQMMALKSGQMSGLNVPKVAIDRAIMALNHNCNTADEGYGYRGPGSTYRMTAVGLLCRQYMERWGPSNPRMIKAVSKHIKANPPNRQDCYYYYYATQVMHHFGGEAWKEWNKVMREYLIKRQDKTNTSPNFGSWDPAGDPFGGAGGRLMITSLNLLTLEVYYRHLPLYYRDAGYKAD